MKARNPIAYVGASLALSALSGVLFSACGSSTCADRGNCTDSGGNGGALAGSGGDAGSVAGTENGGASATGGAAGRGGAGHAGDANSAGAAGTSACDGECKGTTPVCDAASNTCVECLKAGDCKAPTAVCDASSKSCVECAKSTDCKSPTPACDPATSACVECTATTDCKDSSKPFCETTAQQCVACLKQADCTGATASACTAGLCKPCSVDAECSNIAGKSVCAAGTCVQCTVAKESACAGNSCDPATKQCTATKVGTKDLCETCLADSECIGGNQADPDARCVPMKIMGTLRPGGFCLRRVAKTCAQPYKIPLVAVSLSAAPSETYCGINQDATRCEAVVDLTTNGAKCPDSQDTSCGCIRDKNGVCMGAGQGGLCKTVGVDANRCTYACGGPEQCPSGYACGGVGYCH